MQWSSVGIHSRRNCLFNIILHSSASATASIAIEHSSTCSTTHPYPPTIYVKKIFSTFLLFFNECCLSASVIVLQLSIVIHVCLPLAIYQGGVEARDRWVAKCKINRKKFNNWWRRKWNYFWWGIIKPWESQCLAQTILNIPHPRTAFDPHHLLKGEKFAEYCSNNRQ